MITRSSILSSFFAFLLAASLILAAPPQAARAGSIYRVIPGGINSGVCGDTWANGCDLQYAITSKVASGDELWVKTGTYKPSATSDRSLSFNLKDGVAIYGGFAGTETERTQRNWQTNVTTLSGDIGNPGVLNDNSLHVVTGTDISSTAILDGFTIKDGYANGSLPHNNGAGMYTDHGCPTMNNVIFRENEATGGGGMYNLACYSTFTNVTFSENTAYIGGGMYNHNSSRPVLVSVTFDENTATLYGGGLFDTYSSSSLNHVTFTSNQAGYGGGMYCDHTGKPTLNDVTFQGNIAVHAGGGFYEINCASTLTDVIFTDNQADFGGGMTIDTNSGGNSSLTNIIFDGNSATSRGGGVYVYGSSPTLTNVVFDGNTAGTGGGMGNFASHPTLTNVTFSGNTASSGGGIYNFGNSTSSSIPTIRNSLLWGDTGGEVYNDTVSSDSSSSITYSLVQGCKPGGIWNSACGTDGGYNLADADPDFDTDLHLSVTSPAINQGNNDFVNGVFTDLDGDPRIINGVVDLGAYETASYRVHIPAVRR